MKKSKIENSIIVSMYNRKPETLEVIENTFFRSLKNHASEDTEVIILDDCSFLEKETKMLVDKYLPGLKSFGKVTFERNKTNLGFGGSYNKGISMAVGKKILVVNDDVYLTKNSVKNLLKTLDEKSDIGLVGPITRWPFAFTYQHCKQAPILKKYDENNFKRIEDFAHYVKNLMKSKRIKVSWISGYCFAADASKLKEVGMFSSSFKYGTCEDIFLGISMNEKYEVIVNPEVFVYHGGTKGTSTSMHQEIIKSSSMQVRNFFVLGNKVGYGWAIKNLLRGLFIIPIGKCTVSALYDKLSNQNNKNKL
jgi:GT2 family glycosyltransferase